MRAVLDDCVKAGMERDACRVQTKLLTLLLLLLPLLPPLAHPAVRRRAHAP